VDGVQISGGRYNFDGPATNKAYQYELGYTHIFTPSLLMDLRAGYTRISNLSLPSTTTKGNHNFKFGGSLDFGSTRSGSRSSPIMWFQVRARLCGGLNTSPF
jgi:hypothetical protein